MAEGRNGTARGVQARRSVQPGGGYVEYAGAPRTSSEVMASLRRGSWLVVVGLAVGVGVALWIVMLATPVYEADAYALVSPRAADDGGPEAGVGTSTPGEYAQAYAQLVTSPTIVGSATSPLGADPADLEGTLRSEASATSPMLKVSASSPDPDNAADLANAAAEAVASYAEKLSKDTGYRARVVSEATPPAASVWPKPLPTVVAGGVAGLALGVAAALGAYRRRGAWEAEAAGARRNP